MECDVTHANLVNDKLQLVVFDENSTRKDSFLGKGSVSLRKVAAGAIGSKIEIPLELIDEKGAVCAHAVVKCVLLHGSVNIEPLISDNSILPIGTHSLIGLLIH